MLFHSTGRTGWILIAVLGSNDALIALPEVISKCWILVVSGSIYWNHINTMLWVRVNCYVVRVDCYVVGVRVDCYVVAPPLFLG